ncbi:hypothetical protein Tco_1283579 [Tanacetum coccineum]
MPRAIVGDIPLTKSYIPKVSETPGISPTIANFYKPIEDRCIHEGRVVDQLYYTSHHIDHCFFNVRLNCLYEINEPIVPCFVLDFYSQVTLQRDDSAVFTNEWDLSSLAFFQETEGPYYTDLPTPDEIHQFFRFERVDSNHTIKNKSVTLTPNQVLTKEVREDLKRWEELIRENVFSLGGHRDHLPTSLRQTHRPRSDRGIPKAHHPVSSSSTRHFGSSSHQEDDDNDDRTSRASTPSPKSYLNFLSLLTHLTYNIPTSSEQTDRLLFDR